MPLPVAKRALYAIILMLFISPVACSSPAQTATPVPSRVAQADMLPTRTMPPTALSTPSPSPLSIGAMIPTATAAMGTSTRIQMPTFTAIPPASVQLRPEAPVIQGTRPIRVDIALEQLVDLYGVQVRLTFDPSKVQVVDADPSLPDVQISPGPPFRERDRAFVAVNRVDNERGTIDFAVTLLRPARPLVGRAVAASFSLLAKGEGETRIELAQVLLANPQAQPQPVRTEALNIDVRP
ncbi:MAG: hypothetical protein H5T69_02400 [Chloroflexi bacterium]|nr:hypothetical protein [Chloroflexota bacterium]